MFSDIVESTALYEQPGDLRGSEFIRTHNEIFRREVAAHRGHEVNTFGDSFMIAFFQRPAGRVVRDSAATGIRRLL